MAPKSKSDIEAEVKKLNAQKRQLEASLNLAKEVERQTEIMTATNSALVPLALSIKETARRMYEGFSKGLNFDFIKGPSDLLDEAALKADTIFALNQDLVNSIGGLNADAFNPVMKAQQSLYEKGLFYSKKMEYNGKNLRHFYEDEAQLIKEFSAVINDNLMMTHYAVNADAEEMRNITLMGRALGYKEGMIQTFIKRQFALTGEATDDLLHQTLAYALAAEKETGISSKIIAEHMGEMMEEVSLFGHLVPEEMARAATAVAALGLEMSSVTGLVKNFNSFDDAASNVAKLTQALGVQVNVMDVVKLSNEDDPSKLIELFKDAFDVAGHDINALGQPMKRALANIFGVNDTQEIEKMFGGASNSLDQFLAKTDSGIAGVGDAEIDNALSRADANIAQLRVLTGTMTDAANRAGRLQREAMSSALANSVNDIKDDMEGATFSLVKAQSELLSSGALQPVLDSATGIADHALGLMKAKFDRLQVDINAAASDGNITSKEWADIFSSTTGSSEEAIVTERLRAQTYDTAEAQAKAFKTEVKAAASAPGTSVTDQTMSNLTPGDAVRIIEIAEDSLAKAEDRARIDDLQEKILESRGPVEVVFKIDSSNNLVIEQAGTGNSVTVPINP